MLKKLPSFLQNELLQSIGIVASGTIAASVITALTLPALTRLYSPTEFGVLAAVMSLIYFIAPAAALRFDIAVPLPARDRDASSIFALGLLACAGIFLLLLIVFWLFADLIAEHLSNRASSTVLMLVPLGVLLVSVQSVLQYWLVRKGSFGAVSSIRVLQAATSSAVQIATAFLATHVLGLLLGVIIGLTIANIGLACYVALLSRNLMRSINVPNLKKQARLYSAFPRYSALEALANSGSIQLPILLISAHGASEEAGLLLIALTVVQAPLGVLGSAVSQVYQSKAPQQFREGNLAAFTLKILGGLMRAGVGPLLLLGIVSPAVFPIVFGELWQRSGTLVSWMTPWFIAQFLVSPISMSLAITGRVNWALTIQLLGLLFRCSAVAAGLLFAHGSVSEIYALSGAVFYVAYLLSVMRATGISVQQLGSVTWASSPIIFGWVCLALVIRLLLLAIS